MRLTDKQRYAVHLSMLVLQATAKRCEHSALDKAAAQNYADCARTLSELLYSPNPTERQHNETYKPIP